MPTKERNAGDRELITSQPRPRPRRGRSRPGSVRRNFPGLTLLARLRCWPASRLVSREGWPPVGGPLQPSWPSRRRTSYLMSIEFCGVGLFEQRSPVQEVCVAHHEGLIRGGRLAMCDPSTLGLMVHWHVHELTGCAHIHDQPADRGPLVTRPASEIQDHVRAQLQCLQTEPEQPSFQHIALPGRLRIAEQRAHPLIRRQPQRGVLLSQLSSSCGLSGPGQADCHEQRRHAEILPRRPSDQGLSQGRSKPR